MVGIIHLAGAISLPSSNSLALGEGSAQQLTPDADETTSLINFHAHKENRSLKGLLRDPHFWLLAIYLFLTLGIVS